MNMLLGSACSMTPEYRIQTDRKIGPNWYVLSYNENRIVSRDDAITELEERKRNMPKCRHRIFMVTPITHCINPTQVVGTDHEDEEHRPG